jgi:Domain of unknown function (DUF1843)
MSSKKSTSGTKSKKASARMGGPLPPYGVPINEAIASGNLSEMRAMAARTRKHIADVQQALKNLEGKIKKLGG